MKIKNVLIAGRGAVGVVEAEFFFHHQDQARFAFLVDEKRKKRYKQHPLYVNGELRNYPLVSSFEEFGVADLVLFITKYGSLADAMEQAAPFIDNHTILMSATNGILSEEDLRRRFPANQVVHTIAQKMDSVYTGDAVHFTQTGELVIGVDDPSLNPALEAVCDVFNRVRLNYVRSERIIYDQWNKLMLNCGINQTCAVFDATYGQVMASPELRIIFSSAMREVQKTAQAYGIDLQDQDVMNWMSAVQNLSGDSMPSMRQDVLANRPTERILFSGTVIPMADAKGIHTPILHMLDRKLKEIDACNMEISA